VAESTLSGTHTNLLQIIGDYLGIGRDSTAWSTNDTARVNDILVDGLALAYWPSGIPDWPRGYTWNFLTVRTTAATVASTETVTMPDDFGSIVDNFAFTDNGQWWHLDHYDYGLYSEQRQRWIGSTDRPWFFTILPGSTDGGSGQRYTAYFCPTPNAIYTLSYTYRVLPNVVTATGSKIYPYGGAKHFSMIRAACLAVAEMFEDGQHGPRWAYFLDRLRASLQLDLADKPESYGLNLDRGMIGRGWDFQDGNIQGVTSVS